MARRASHTVTAAARALDLSGRTPEEIEAELQGLSPAELRRMVARLATLEPWFKPSEIAARRRMSVREVRAAMKRGDLGGGYYRRSGNSMLASASGVAAWDASFFVGIGQPGGKK